MLEWGQRNVEFGDSDRGSSRGFGGGHGQSHSHVMRAPRGFGMSHGNEQPGINRSVGGQFAFEADW